MSDLRRLAHDPPERTNKRHKASHSPAHVAYCQHPQASARRMAKTQAAGKRVRPHVETSTQAASTHVYASARRRPPHVRTVQKQDRLRRRSRACTSTPHSLAHRGTRGLGRWMTRRTGLGRRCKRTHTYIYAPSRSICAHRRHHTHAPTSSVRDKPACPRPGKMRQDERQLRNTFRKRARWGAEYDRRRGREASSLQATSPTRSGAVSVYRRPHQWPCTTYAAQHTEARRRPPPDAVYARGNPSRTVHADSARPPSPPDDSSGH
jgi:hypothetical protein